MTLLGLAAKAEVSHAMIQRLESGERSPSREMVVKLASALGASIDSALFAAGFLPESALEFVSNRDEAALLLAFRAGDERAKRMISAMAREMAAG